MVQQTILFSNIGYAKGIDGTLWKHIQHMHRHIYSRVALQQEVLNQLKAIIQAKQPDLCCFVELDQGSWHSAHFNQMSYLADGPYVFHDSSDKYGADSRLGRMPLHVGKSNGFMSTYDLSFERLYFQNGTKRLFYKIALPGNIDLLFGHFSLQKKVRVRQFQEIHDLVQTNVNPIIILGDFNIMHGLSELNGLLKDTNLHLLNKPDQHTFTFHRRQMALDIGLCSVSLKARISLDIIQQTFSDHAALLVKID